VRPFSAPLAERERKKRRKNKFAEAAHFVKSSADSERSQKNFTLLEGLSCSFEPLLSTITWFSSRFKELRKSWQKKKKKKKKKKKQKPWKREFFVVAAL
jgi:hypothetical protein